MEYFFGIFGTFLWHFNEGISTYVQTTNDLFILNSDYHDFKDALITQADKSSTAIVLNLLCQNIPASTDFY